MLTEFYDHGTNYIKSIPYVSRHKVQPYIRTC